MEELSLGSDGQLECKETASRAHKFGCYGTGKYVIVLVLILNARQGFLTESAKLKCSCYPTLSCQKGGSSSISMKLFIFHARLSKVFISMLISH